MRLSTSGSCVDASTIEEGPMRWWGFGAVQGSSVAMSFCALGVASSIVAGCASDAAPRASTESAERSSERASSTPPGLRAAWIRALHEDASPAYDWSIAREASSSGVRWQVSTAGLRVASDDGWHMRLASRRFGREGALAALPEATVRTEGNDARLVRPGLVERWLHGPLGVEHLFEVTARPAGEGALVIELELEGLSPALVGDEVTLSNETGVQARYAELWVQDAGGAVVPSRLEVVEGTLRIRVDDADARYPLVIDPLVATQQAELGADDGARSDGFGAAVALSGDTALVGAPFTDTSAGLSDVGSAYVFVRTGTSWTQQAKLVASDGSGLDRFGITVALSGDTALVGATGDDTARGIDVGSAYVFVRSGTSWTQHAKLEASDAQERDTFGSAVALDGDTALVGARNVNLAGAFGAGAAYVFVRSGTSWTQQARLVASDGAESDALGAVVALDGDTALVGAFIDDTARGIDAGSAYVFVRSGTTWSQQAKLEASDGAARDTFGTAVALSGNTALVGAAYADTARGPDAGAAYVFVRSGTSWTQQARLEPSEGMAGEMFGEEVALSGDMALLGVPLHTSTRGTFAGATYVFVRSGTSWSQQATLEASDGREGDYFGAELALFGSTALISALWGDTSRGFDVGSAYVFLLQRSDGDACVADVECASGFCVDGVCCASACGGGATDCQACSVAAGAATNGTCGPSTGNACDDGRFCTAGDVCSAGTCGGTRSRCSTGTTCTEIVGGSFMCSECPAGTFSPSGTGILECTPCEAGTWSSSGAMYCMPWTDCPEGTFVATTGTSSRDRVCMACASGTFADMPNQTSCRAWTECGPGEWVAYEGSDVFDRWCLPCPDETYAASGTCLPWTTCTSAQYESAPPSATRDRVCTALTVCDAEEYEAVPPSATRDRVCRACTVCEAGERSPCTATADAVCESLSDAGMPGVDASVPRDASVASDGQVGVDAGTDVTVEGGCGCATIGAERGGSRVAWVLLGLVMALARRRRRSR
jgi:MYXO-CTERM domain-containing protein